MLRPILSHLHLKCWLKMGLSWKRDSNGNSEKKLSARCLLMTFSLIYCPKFIKYATQGSTKCKKSTPFKKMENKLFKLTYTWFSNKSFHKSLWDYSLVLNHRKPWMERTFANSLMMLLQELSFNWGHLCLLFSDKK